MMPLDLDAVKLFDCFKLYSIVAAIETIRKLEGLVLSTKVWIICALTYPSKKLEKSFLMECHFECQFSSRILATKQFQSIATILCPNSQLKYVLRCI